MDISRREQRILHRLAQGGRIAIERDERHKIAKIALLTRDGWLAPGLDLIASKSGEPYRITQRGLELVRAEQDNR